MREQDVNSETNSEEVTGGKSYGAGLPSTKWNMDLEKYIFTVDKAYQLMVVKEVRDRDVYLARHRPELTGPVEAQQVEQARAQDRRPPFDRWL